MPGRDRMRCVLLGGLLAVSSAAGRPQAPGRSASALLAQAGRELAAGQFTAAIAGYRSVLELSPRDMAAQIGLAESYRAVHNYDETRRLLEQAQRDHPRSAKPLAAFGDFDIEMQTYDAAIVHLRAALALDPADIESRGRLAVAYRAKGDLSGALAETGRVLARDPGNALAIFTRAQVYADQNKDELARRDARKVVELDPQNPQGRALLGEVLLRTPQPAVGDGAGDAGGSAEPADSSTAYTRQCVEAVKVLAPLMPALAHDSKTLYLLARAYRCAGDAANAGTTMKAFEAASQNDRSTKENQTQAKHLVEQADDLAIKNDLSGSLDLLRQAIEKDPSYGPAYSLQAKLYFSSGDLEKASEAISRALALDRYEPDFLYVQGKILEKQRNLQEALAAFQQCILVNPRESDAYFEIGEIHRQQEDREGARAAYKKALEISPGDADYQRALDALGPKPNPKPEP